MCGRYALTIDQNAFEDAFGALPPADFAPRYNIAPTQPAPVVRAAESNQREAVDLPWGFRHNDPGRRAPLINARSETAAEKRSFSESFRERRCLVPANGYYEWRQAGSARQPILFRSVKGEPFAFAGLWQATDGGGRFTILTTTASDTVAPIHDRMPIVLPLDLYGPWLDPSLEDAEQLGHLLRQAPEPVLAATEVSSLVNSVANEGPECWREPKENPQASLF